MSVRHIGVRLNRDRDDVVWGVDTGGPKDHALVGSRDPSGAILGYKVLRMLGHPCSPYGLLDKALRPLAISTVSTY